MYFQELSILQDIGDLNGECRAHGNLGAVHMSLGNNTLALRCFQEQLDRAKVGEILDFSQQNIYLIKIQNFGGALKFCCVV